MKKTICLVCAALLAFSLTACNSSEEAVTSPGDTSVASSEITTEQQTTVAPPESDAKLVTFSARPIDAAADMLILQDPTNQQYGLYKITGEEILPCEYGDMKFITVNNNDPKVYVAAQSKGSYGIYDLTGVEIAAPVYDNVVEGARYADSIIVRKADVFGAVDLQGNEIVPVQYADVASSPKGLLGAVTSGTACNVDLYTSDGTLQGSFQTELVQTGTITGGNGNTTLTFSDGGNKVNIRSDNGRQTYGQSCTLDGTVVSASGLVGNVSIDGNYFASWSDGVLSFTDAEGNSIVSTEVGVEAAGITISGSLERDGKSGNITGVVTCIPIDSNFKTPWDGSSYLISLGETSSVSHLGQFDPFVQATISLKVGRFYNDKAFAMENNTIYVIDRFGNKEELPTAANKASGGENLLYENCAILNNNGYIYVIDKDGNEILSDSGYADVDWTYYRGEGLIVLTASDGTTQLIDTYGNEIVPKGNSYQQATLYNAQGEDIKIYSLIHDMTADKYIFTDNENLRAFESHEEMNEDFAEKLFGGQGWVLWDDAAQKLIAVVSSENGYQVCDVAGLAE